jgi:hypothetical protein
MPDRLIVESMRVEARRCPGCGRRVDAATLITSGEIRSPKAGDLTICAYCTAVLVFTTAGFRFAVEADLDGIDPKMRAIALRLIRDLKPLP